MTRLGDFWNILTTNLFTKVASKDFGRFKKGSLYLKYSFYLFGQLRETFGHNFYSYIWSYLSAGRVGLSGLVVHTDGCKFEY